MNKPYFCRNFFLTDWHHKRLKNIIDLLLFYGEQFYGFSESVLRKTKKEYFADVTDKENILANSQTTFLGQT